MGLIKIDEKGEKTFIESGESGKSISDLGIKVYKEITESDVNNALKDAEHVGETEYNGKKYFVAAASPTKQSEI